ncbi:hypothetical protein DFH06DRAFT_1326720 [Mycena polygramma]|nr:hypothetical protein DFH06DRAFT_1326720 [Mycena polygramma]
MDDFVEVNVRKAAERGYEKLIRRLRRAPYDNDTEEWLSRIWIKDLWNVTLADHECMRKVLKYASAACNAPLPASNVGLFGVLPLEMFYPILELLSVATRVCLGRTSKGFHWIRCAYLQHELQVLLVTYHLDFGAVRLMLTATASIMTGWAFHSIFNGRLLATDTFDFITTEHTSRHVLAFITLSTPYTLTNVTRNGGWYKTWTLKLGEQKIRVMEYPVDYGTAMLTSHTNYRMGFWDGSVVRHPYGGVAYDRIAFATPSSLPIRNKPRELKKVWEIIHGATDHDVAWVFEYEESHICSKHPYCPVSLRRTLDSGWLNLRLPEASFGSAPAGRNLSWSLDGSGCNAGILEGGAFEAMSVVEDEDWYNMMNQLMERPAYPEKKLIVG